MSEPNRPLIAAGFTGILLLLGVTDAIVTRGTVLLPRTTVSVAADGGAQSSGAKSGGLPVEDVLRTQRIETAETSEQSILSRIVAEPGLARTRVLLKNGDRMAILSWMETSDVKQYFNAVKDALHAAFSPDMKDLKDETLSTPGRPTADVLSFRDPGIDPERLVFVRVRQRLYELHITEGKEKDAQELLDALTR